MDIETVKQNMKKKHHQTNHQTHKKVMIQKKHKRYFFLFSIRFLLCIVITIVCVMALKENKEWKSKFYQYVFEQNFSFATINKTYQKYFGSPIPFFNQLIKEPTKAVFHEKLTYQKEQKYQDGVKLTVEDQFLVPSLESGIVVFIGKKEGYGNKLIVQQANGIDCWYGNIKNLSVKLYDYVEKGSALGEVENNLLYLVFKKDGAVLDYKNYINE